MTSNGIGLYTTKVRTHQYKNLHTTVYSGFKRSCQHLEVIMMKKPQ